MAPSMQSFFLWTVRADLGQSYLDDDATAVTSSSTLAVSNQDQVMQI